MCEWQTEQAYFSIIKLLSTLWVRLEIKLIWKLSWKNKWKLIELRNKIEYSDLELEDTNSKVFFITDIDWYNRESYSQKEISFIKSNLETKNINVLFSNKDFELWILLHLEQFNKSSWNYIKEIRKYKKDYKKWWCVWNLSFFEKIITKSLENAIKNSKYLNKLHKDKKNLKDMLPYTEVYKIFN